jgi:WD40 repeat protein
MGDILLPMYCLFQETAIMGHVIASFKVKSKGLRCFAGIAINSDGTLLAVSNIMGNRISIFEPSSFKLLREFGTEGSGPGQFNDPSNVVFSPNGHLLVAEGANRRIQEVTVTGEHVRYLHEDLWISLDGMTVVDDQVVVCTRDDDARIVVLDYASGNIIRSFGRTGDAPGKLAGGCKGVCPTPDHKHLLVAEDLTNRVSVFTMSGEFVRNCCFLNPHQNDTKLRSERPAAVCVGPLGELIIPGHEFLYLFSADGSRLLRKIEMDLYASLDGVFHDGKLYVLNGNTGVVKVIV